MDKAIGGYFELELPQREEFHKNALWLNSGKNCLEYILRARHYKKVYIPYYTCDVILKPFMKLNISYEFYHINMQFEIVDRISLQGNEALLYTNYYGLKNHYVNILSQKYGNRLILDNTQAFFAKPLKGIDSFYTCRKFFGVPDGAYLYCDVANSENLERSTSFEEFGYLLKRIDLSAEEGYEDYHVNEEHLECQPIRAMSNLTQRLMRSIDYNEVARKRRANYEILHKALGNENNVELLLEDDAVPMVYPFLSLGNCFRQKLIDNKIFVARYWPNVLEWTKKTDIEYLLAYQMQPLPIDQRYGEKEMGKIIDVINIIRNK